MTSTWDTKCRLRLQEWLFRERVEGTVLLLDPNSVLQKPVTEEVDPGQGAGDAVAGLAER